MGQASAGERRPSSGRWALLAMQLLLGCSQAAGPDHEPEDLARAGTGGPVGAGARAAAETMAAGGVNAGAPGEGASGVGEPRSDGAEAGSADAAVQPADAGADDSGDAEEPSYAAPCMVSADSVVCEHTIAQIPAGSGTRDVYWAAPIGPAPEAGYPLAIIFQGSFFGPSFTWQELTPDFPFGGYYQGLLHVKLLEAGFVVVEPEAEGGVAWQTNAGGDYATSSDHALMLELFRRFAQSEDFGKVDSTRLYACGISSGGYMTSRMAVSHPGTMRALAIQSGSYATCLGPLCSVPSDLPSDHPPTLFLHGDADGTVPIDTAISYRDALDAQGTKTDMIVGMGIGHAWLHSAPQEVTQWFVGH